MASKPEKIKRSWVPQRKAFERENKNTEFYNSRAWRSKSKSYKVQNPLCVECLKNELVVPATVADHIVPVNAGGSKFSNDNIQSLCESCHNRKSSNESRGYGVKSQE